MWPWGDDEGDAMPDDCPEPVERCYGLYVALEQAQIRMERKLAAQREKRAASYASAAKTWDLIVRSLQRSKGES